jgi:hypothetical protein
MGTRRQQRSGTRHRHSWCSGTPSGAARVYATCIGVNDDIFCVRRLQISGETAKWVGSCVREILSIDVFALTSWSGASFVACHGECKADELAGPIRACMRRELGMRLVVLLEFLKNRWCRCCILRCSWAPSHDWNHCARTHFVMVLLPPWSWAGLQLVRCPALCSVEHRGSDLTTSFLALALALFDCRGGSKENYKFFIIFLGREFASFCMPNLPPVLTWHFWAYLPSPWWLGGLVWHYIIIFIY